ncbi:MAG: type 1 glutamine amidotransferase [Halanaerobiales bacterium]|nr:type 1 glutamine amidotransferase [Halanaerobiales bacterium]
MRPLIGITTAWSVETWGDPVEKGGYYYVEKHYVEAVVRAGGLPLLITPELISGDLNQLLASLFSSVHGLLFSGGGEARNSSTEQLPSLYEQQPARSSFEAKLIEEAWARKIPVIGLCRGHQMIAEVLGGEMLEFNVPGHQQDITALKPWHLVTLNRNSKIFSILGIERWPVNSFHKQVIGKIPAGFRVTMRSDEGLIEGMEAIDHPYFMGFQFHPESLALTDRTALRIFEELIANSTEYMKGLYF